MPRGHRRPGFPTPSPLEKLRIAGTMRGVVGRAALGAGCVGGFAADNRAGVVACSYRLTVGRWSGRYTEWSGGAVLLSRLGRPIS